MARQRELILPYPVLFFFRLWMDLVICTRTGAGINLLYSVYQSEC